MKTKKYLVRCAISHQLYGIVSSHLQEDKTISSIINCINEGEKCTIIEFSHDVNKLLDPNRKTWENFKIVLDGDIAARKLLVEFAPIYEY